MKIKTLLFILSLLATSLLASFPAQAVECSIYADCRYVAQPVRDANGEYIRSSLVKKHFVLIHACPSTGSHNYKDPCPGWAINHMAPLACGGIDAVWNMWWVAYDVKHTVGPHALDSVELKIGALEPPVPDTPKCKNKLVL